MAILCEHTITIENFINEYIKHSNYKLTSDSFKTKIVQYQQLTNEVLKNYQHYICTIHSIQGILILNYMNDTCYCILIAYSERACRDLLLCLPDNILLECNYNDKLYSKIVKEFIVLTDNPSTHCMKGYKNSSISSTGIPHQHNTIITSKKDPLIQECKKYNSLVGRIKNNRFIAEGSLLVKRALSDGQLIEEVFYTDNNKNQNDVDIKIIIDLCKMRKISCHSISSGIMSAITDTHPLPNVICIIKMTVYNQNDLILSNKSNCLLIIDGVSNSDNLGMILRTADACGINAVILLSNSTHFMNKNAIRGARGAIGKIPIYMSDNDMKVFNILHNNNFKIIGTSARFESESLYSTEYNNQNLAIVIGSESNGIRNEILDLCTDFVKIPMVKGQSSLNVAVAAGVLMYEYVRKFYC